MAITVNAQDFSKYLTGEVTYEKIEVTAVYSEIMKVLTPHKGIDDNLSEEDFWGKIRQYHQDDLNDLEYFKTIQIALTGDDGSLHLFIISVTAKSIVDVGAIYKNHAPTGVLKDTMLEFGCSFEEGLLMLLLSNGFNNIVVPKEVLLSEYHANRDSEEIQLKKDLVALSVDPVFSRQLELKESNEYTPYMHENIINIVRKYNPMGNKSTSRLTWAMSRNLNFNPHLKTSFLHAIQSFRSGVVDRASVNVNTVDFASGDITLEVQLKLNNQKIYEVDNLPNASLVLPMKFNFKDRDDVVALTTLLLSNKLELGRGDNEEYDLIVSNPFDRRHSYSVADNGAVRILGTLLCHRQFEGWDTRTVEKAITAVHSTIGELVMKGKGFKPSLFKMIAHTGYAGFSTFGYEENCQPSWDDEEIRLLTAVHHLSKVDELVGYIETTVDKYSDGTDSGRDELVSILEFQLRSVANPPELGNLGMASMYTYTQSSDLAQIVDGVRYAIVDESGNSSVDLPELDNYKDMRVLYQNYMLSEVALRTLPDTDSFVEVAKNIKRSTVISLAESSSSNWRYSSYVPRLFKGDTNILTDLIERRGQGSYLYYLREMVKLAVATNEVVSQEVENIFMEAFPHLKLLLPEYRSAYLAFIDDEPVKLKSKKVFQGGLDGNVWRQILEHQELHRTINLILPTIKEGVPVAVLSDYQDLIVKMFSSDLPAIVESANVPESSRRQLSPIVNMLYTKAGASEERIIAEIEYLIEDTMQRQRIRTINASLGLYLDMLKAYDVLVNNGYRSYERFPYSPVSLNLEHDIFTYESEQLSEGISEVAMTDKYRDLMSHEGVWEEIDIKGIKDPVVLVAPKDSDDLKKEGNGLNHCVGGYASRILEGQCLILFLRRASNPEKPFITVELHVRKLRNGKCTYGLGQVQGSNANGYRNPTADVRNSIIAHIKNAVELSHLKKAKEEAKLKEEQQTLEV